MENERDIQNEKDKLNIIIFIPYIYVKSIAFRIILLLEGTQRGLGPTYLDKGQSMFPWTCNTR